MFKPIIVVLILCATHFLSIRFGAELNDAAWGVKLDRAAANMELVTCQGGSYEQK